MTETKTLAGRRREVEDARRVAEETLEQERQALSPEVLAGDKQSSQRLEVGF